MPSISYCSPDYQEPTATMSSHQIFEKLVLEESISLRRAVLIYQMVGRVLFTEIILAVTFWQPVRGLQLPMMLFVILLATLWFLESIITSRRAQLISRLIAETDYSDDPKWGSLFIKLHYHRYAGALGRVFANLRFLEPILWGSLCLWLLLAR